MIFKKTALVLIISILLFSCSSSDDDIIENPEVANYIVHSGSSLEINNTENGTFIEVVNGENLVFEYRFSTEGRPEIADDEFTDVVFFELDADVEDFNLTAANFEEARTYLGKFCFCGQVGYFKVTSGSINGQKTGNLTWEVSLDVEALIEAENNVPEINYEVRASGNFKPQG